MLKKRLIFSLLFEKKNFHLSRNFRLQEVGNLEWLKKYYNFGLIKKSVDEIILLNVSREKDEIESFVKVIKEFIKDYYIPLSVGGKINSVDIAEKYISAGADKLVINTNLFNFSLIEKLSKKFGKQSLIGSLDYKITNDNIEIFQLNGTRKINKSFKKILKEISKLPIGELKLNSINQDGTGQGFNFKILEYLPKNFNKPIIFSGGAGNYRHLIEAFNKKQIDGVATANIINFVGDGLQEARKKIIKNGIKLAKWVSI